MDLFYLYINIAVVNLLVCAGASCVHDVSGGTHATTRTSRCVASPTTRVCNLHTPIEIMDMVGRHSRDGIVVLYAWREGRGSRTCHVAPLTRRGRRAVAVRDSARL